MSLGSLSFFHFYWSSSGALEPGRTSKNTQHILFLSSGCDCSVLLGKAVNETGGRSVHIEWMSCCFFCFFFSPVHSDVVLCVCLCGSVVRLMQAQMGGDEHCLGFYLLCLLNLTPDHLSVCFHYGPICSLLFSKHTFGHFQFRP